MSSYRRGRGSPETDINILLLGESGVGKTTFINAFINCLFYDTLDDALNGELKVLIPSSFTVTDSETYKSELILVGTPNNNENCHADGQSSTQSCRSYIFQIGNRLVRLIDGPGVGDTRTVDHEARNFEHILRYINQYEHLNGICILFKPAETRLNIYFRYCIKELLRHLHFNAKDNIMFVFTNSRATFYQPGDTSTLLKVLLKELHDKTGVEVPFHKENTFMFDNESFRFLAACKQGSKFLMKYKQDYSISWNKSVEEFARLITRILKCDLHSVKETQSLNDAQILIHQLSRPIGEIATLIQENILMAKQYKEKLLNNQTNDMSNKIPQKTGKFIPLRERVTVCVNEKCTEIVKVNGEQKINYNSNCHVGCSLHRTVQECIGHPVIKGCRALKKTGQSVYYKIVDLITSENLFLGSCRKCGCDWTKHMHITYRYERNLTYVELDNSNSKQTPQSIMSLIDNRISELRKEEAAIRHICVKLSQFLQANSITPFNDDMIEYMRHFINEEKQKQRAGTDNTEVILGLEQMLKDYTDEVNLYTKSISSQATSMSSDNFDNAKQIDEIYTLVRQLYELPINGKLIEDQVTQMNRGREQAATLDEQYVDLPTAANSPRILLDLKDIVDRKKR
jgi:GTPase SAR1 family protein